MSKQQVNVTISYLDAEDRELDWDDTATSVDEIPAKVRELAEATTTRQVTVKISAGAPFPHMIGELE